MSWQPNPATYQEILRLLSQSQVGVNVIQKSLHQQLDALAKTQADFCLYLCEILVKGQSVDSDVRQVAGLDLKNVVHDRITQLHPDVVNYIKQAILPAVGDELRDIRSTAGTVIATVAGAVGFARWPELLTFLMGCLNSNKNFIEGAFNALLKLAENNPQSFDDASIGSPLNALIPKLIPFFSHEDPIFREYSITIAKQFLLLLPNALLVNFPAYINALLLPRAGAGASCAMDPSVDVRRRVLQSLTLMVVSKPDLLAPFYTQVIGYIALMLRDAEEDVAMEACEFIAALSEKPELCRQLIRPVLNQNPPSDFIPLILKHMEYSAIDVTLMNENDEHVQDRPTDLPPVINEGHLGGAAAGQHLDDEAGGDEEDEEDEEDDDDEAEEQGEAEWTLRKSAGAALDSLASAFGAELIPHVLPHLDAKLNSPEWPSREAAILALGAIAKSMDPAAPPAAGAAGAAGGLDAFLPQIVPWLVVMLDIYMDVCVVYIVPWLVVMLSDPKALIRSITCWTIGRYAGWIVSRLPQENHFQAVLGGVMQRILDSTKKVQAAACSTFSVLVEAAGVHAVPYLGPIIENLNLAQQRYQQRNLIRIYDALTAVVEVVGPAIRQPALEQALMTPLSARLSASKPDDRSVFPLMWAINSVAQAMGPDFAPWALPIIQHALGMVQNTLALKMVAKQAGAEIPDKDFIASPLDLVAGIVEALKEPCVPLLAQTNIMALLQEAVKDDIPPIRQSGFGLLGDLAQYCYDFMAPHIGGLFQAPWRVQQRTQKRGMMKIGWSKKHVCNNAVWALGHVALKARNQLAPAIPQIVEALLPIINVERKDGKVPRQYRPLLQNASITLGALAIGNAPEMGPSLTRFSRHWIGQLATLHDDPEKADAFRGLCALIRTHPAAIFPEVPFILAAISTWAAPPEDLRADLNTILGGIKTQLGAQWPQFYGSLPQDVRDRLLKNFQYQ
ncbi:putative Importin subunit beta-2 [Paratrimastix pyriformis]|uniref:Importin subunit beta-2 n=1 Tax=Paratrimastix pyriformis TaxID=342808 RepID=A0ABQ8UJC2_9EUKA|nr:putative Importin subunit beta-2 [Paratrimastix pyriformis]